jgi:hypothetical protein
MKAPVALACWLILLAPTVAMGAGDSDRSPNLTSGNCLDTSRIRGWSSIDDNLILVDDGRHKYRIEVAPGCNALKFTHSIAFKGDPISGRVCGLGDEIVTRDYPCNIQRMELLTTQQYKQAKADYLAEKKARKDAKKSKTP